MVLEGWREKELAKAYPDHDWETFDGPDLDGSGTVPWAGCRRCGVRLALDDRTQILPSMDCDAELVKGIMRS